MSNSKKAELLKLAKGNVQRELLSDLLNHGSSHTFNKYQNGTRYASSYHNSFKNLIERLRAHNINVKIIDGKRGGMYSAYAILS